MFNPQYWSMVILMITVLGVSGTLGVAETFWVIIVLILIGFAMFRNKILTVMQVGISMLLLILSVGSVGTFTAEIVASVI